jgi:hypothetical protein
MESNTAKGTGTWKGDVINDKTTTGLAEETGLGPVERPATKSRGNTVARWPMWVVMCTTMFALFADA